MVGPMMMRADEINCLVYAYLRDSGLNHTAFSLLNEAQLDGSPNFQKHIPHGELIELLGKSLLFVEVEKHWAGNNRMVTNCTAPFSLLEEHSCAVDPALKSTASLEIAMGIESFKRKAGDDLDGGHVAKRARADTQTSTANGTGSFYQLFVRAIMDGTGNDSQAKNVAVAPKIAPKSRMEPPKSTTFDPAVIGPSGEAVQLFCAAAHPHDLQLIAAGSRDGSINIKTVPATGPALDASRDKVLKVAGDVDGDITSMDWSPDGRLLSIACYDHQVRVITHEGSLYLEGSAHANSVFASKFSKDSKWLISAGLDCTTCVWNIPEKRIYKQVRHGGCCLDLEWVGEDIFAVCCSDNKVHIMHIDGTAPFASFIGHSSEVNSIKYNPATNHLASCSDDSTARIWSLDTIRATVTTEQTVKITECIVFKGHSAPVNNIGWAGPPGAEVLVTSSFDSTSRMWDARTGACLMIFNDHTRPIFSIGVSPDRCFFATGGSDGWLHVYSVHKFERVWSWRHTVSTAHGVFDVAWRRNDTEKINRFALALESGEICVVNANMIPELQ
ncbi:WD40-repeat-containing domain protein [Vararia minispora EC-137]|uniref:WD40-repeat-containing domain protein n=1 Tax=Vararia minispora EC-137 TaxID=1314806 RepID=A0ACB8QHU4_9AGAM|nr:WD40-repeat-containing domain protein [Vararia minispora EC-137]